MPSQAATSLGRKADQKQRPAKPAIDQAELWAQKQIPPARLVERAIVVPEAVMAGNVLQLQRTLGNQAVGQLLGEKTTPPPIQRLFDGSLAGKNPFRLAIQYKRSHPEDTREEGEIAKTIQQFRDEPSVSYSDTARLFSAVAASAPKTAGVAASKPVAAPGPVIKPPALTAATGPVVKPPALTAAAGAPASGVAAGTVTIAPGSKSTSLLAAPQTSPASSATSSRAVIEPAPMKVPRDRVLIVYRGEDKRKKLQRLEDRQRLGGLVRYDRTAATAEVAFGEMAAKLHGLTFPRGGAMTMDQKLDMYSQGLIQHGQGNALATARTTEGAYTSDYNYTIRIENVYLFYLEENTDPHPGTPIRLGAEIPADAPITKPYVVLNAATLAASTIIGFGHTRGTQEITFFSDLLAKSARTGPAGEMIAGAVGLEERGAGYEGAPDFVFTKALPT